MLRIRIVPIALAALTLACSSTAAEPLGEVVPAPARPAAVEPATHEPADFTPVPIRTAPGGAIRLDDAQRAWVESTLASLPLERKVAQMVVPWTGAAYLPVDSDAFDSVQRLVVDLGVGGVIVSIGAVGDMALRLNLIQRLADVPLLISTDMEHGPGQRLDAGTVLPYGWDLGGGTDFPPAMGLGASGDPAHAEAMGRITALEARAVGFNWTFAPVVDVNSNPDNPIINVRSYGESPELVARMAVAHLRGLHSGGMLATAKHFPGHGDVATDSHIEMPVLSAPRARVDALELVPFRAAIEAGVAAIMPAHIAYPALTGDSIPATLNPAMLTGLLRQELGFDGLIVTDALDMGALVRRYGQGDAAVRAVQAGADVLLQPVDPFIVVDAVTASVRDGRIAEARIDASVRRILGAKAALGLHTQPLIDAALVPYRVGGRTHDSIAADAARASIVIARSQDDALGALRRGRRVLHVVYAAYTDPFAGRTIQAEIASDVRESELIRLDARPDSSDLARVQAAARRADVVLFSLFIGPSAGAGGVSLPATLATAIDDIARAKTAIGVSFGNPYLLREVPALDAYVLAWGGSVTQQRAAARALLGTAPVSGRMPISIPGLVERGAGSGVAPAPSSSSPSSSSPSSDRNALTRVDSIIERAIADRVTPGAALAVVRGTHPPTIRGYGRTTYDADAPEVTGRTIYDIASLSKVIGTTTAAMSLVADGRLDLDATVGRYLPAFFPDTAPAPHTVSDVDDPDAFHGPLTAANARITIRQLLTHTSGLPDWRPLYQTTCGRDGYARAIAAEPLVAMPGTKRSYSDLGFILLGLVLEAAVGEPLDSIVAHRIAQPLGMRDTRYNPHGPPYTPALLPSADALCPFTDEIDRRQFVPLARIAPTEVDDYRGGLVHGFVHDENAYALGGVAGHAGLFSSAVDLAAFGRLLLQAVQGLQGAIDPVVSRRFTRGPTGITAADSVDQRVGWAGPRIYASAGDAFGATSFGHLGFTGTSIWIDPELDLVIVLLTNRVHPTRKGSGITELRRAVSRAVRDAVVDAHR
ncbi:MAG TPA: glycoside hydrolase family 3 N-terminal domain-containing protein [Longimicrobiales bacterium]|nr:glycoside hydrolase family 3 N-terminal domain-containing protein [Longimicrobiales bacterium]